MPREKGINRQWKKNVFHMCMFHKQKKGYISQIGRMMDCLAVFVNQVLRLAELKSEQCRDGFQALQNIRFGISIALKLSTLDTQRDGWLIWRGDGDILSRAFFPPPFFFPKR